MATGTVLCANLSPLKRTFDQIALSAEPIVHNEGIPPRRQYAERRSLSEPSALAEPQIFRHRKRRTLSTPSVNSMLSQSPTIMSTSFPSFMSVYGNEDSTMYNHSLSEQDSKPDQFSLSPYSVDSNQSQHRLVERRGSLASTTSCSTESSPTTTSSTFDSPLMPEPSPDSSPESATSMLPQKSFQRPSMISAGTQTSAVLEERWPMAAQRPAPKPEQTTEEPKRNLKKLTLDMQLPSLMRPGADSDAFSAPASPFREPLKTGRRKPNNLTIRTPGFNQVSFGANALAIPPTPGQKPTLHQAQSDPLLPTLISPTTGPVGGMRLALPNIAQSMKRDSISGSNGGALALNLPTLREEPYEPPKSQEAPERGYTDGPCLIYDTGVYLYLEPTAEEAARFDTVINVAREIKSPFNNSSQDSNTVMSVWRGAGNRQSIVEPQTAASEVSFKSAFEWPTEDGSATPTTPRPLSGSQTKRPEYLHVKWDHNSEILEDLLPLCQLVDDRTREGKKVLIHCQLGVSRSASLIIAYGLYKGYESDFHSMYMAVKQRSQWVGPNMSLIYQLTDFKTKCDRGEYENCITQPKSEWFICNSESVATPTAAPQPTQHVDQSKPTELNTGARPVLRLNKELPPVPPFPINKHDLSLTTAPPGTEPSTMRLVKPPVRAGEKAARRAVPRALPFRQMGYSNQDMTIPPHRPRAVPGLTFAQPSMDLAMKNEPATPSLFSPRVTEFVAAPFGVTTAGDLVTTTPKTVKPPPGAFPGGNSWRNSLFMGPETQGLSAAPTLLKPLPHDPRSPHQTSEPREIFRSIDGIL